MCVKKIFMMLTLAMLVQFGWGQEVSYQLSSHILDFQRFDTTIRGINI